MEKAKGIIIYALSVLLAFMAGFALPVILLAKGVCDAVVESRSPSYRSYYYDKKES